MAVDTSFDSPALPIMVAVLAGGESRRMGRDKATIDIGGMTLLERVCRTATEAGLPVIVVGRESCDWPAAIRKSYQSVPDNFPRCGPLGGLEAALNYAHDRSVLLCATDLLQIRPEDFQWLANQVSTHSNSEWSGVIPMWNGKAEPLFALYHQRVLPLVNQRLCSGDLAMRGLITAGNFHMVSLPSSHITAITDVDTPADLSERNLLHHS